MHCAGTFVRIECNFSIDSEVLGNLGSISHFDINFLFSKMSELSAVQIFGLKKKPNNEHDNQNESFLLIN